MTSTSDNYLKISKPVILPRILNPLSPNSDQHQFYPNDIHTLLRTKSMRINKLTTKRSIFDLLLNSLK